MKLVGCLIAAPLVLACTAWPQNFAGETLPFAINWPSGLGLGEAVMTAEKVKAADGAERWRFELKLDASVPGFVVSDRFRSETTADFCSIEFERTTRHGKRTSSETITFDQAGKKAKRVAKGGGKSEVATSACAKDPLALLYFARKELKQGRVPAAQPAYFGSAYQVKFEASGAQKIRTNEGMAEADRIVGSFKGPSSQATFEAFFARDSLRTPLLIRIPLPVAALSVELAR